MILFLFFIPQKPHWNNFQKFWKARETAEFSKKILRVLRFIPHLYKFFPIFCYGPLKIWFFKTCLGTRNCLYSAEFPTLYTNPRQKLHDNHKKKSNFEKWRHLSQFSLNKELSHWTNLELINFPRWNSYTLISRKIIFSLHLHISDTRYATAISHLWYIQPHHQIKLCLK